MPGRIPGQVVMQYGVKATLQIDAFRQTIRAHQDVITWLRSESRNARLTLNRWQKARHRFNPHFAR